MWHGYVNTICITMHMLMNYKIIHQVYLLFVFSFSFKYSPTSLLHKIDTQIEHEHLSAITYLNGSSSSMRRVKNRDFHRLIKSFSWIACCMYMLFHHIFTRLPPFIYSTTTWGEAIMHTPRRRTLHTVMRIRVGYKAFLHGWMKWILKWWWSYRWR